MSKKLSIESLTKKLKNVANTQDSIPMFSLWIIHHKVHCELIVNTWLEILKTSNTKHRLTLWYLANDVIQSCGRKKADVFKDYFANILPEAIAFLRDKTILPGVERVLNVWSSRNIYDTEIIDQLHAALLTNRPPDKLRQKLLAEYKPSVLMDSISAFKKREDIVLFDEKHLKNVRVDASCSDDIHKLKDKVGGEIFSRNFEESAMNIERFMSEYEQYVEERKKLVDSLTQGAMFYRAQYHEAKIVVNAYQSFDARVSKMKKLLDQVKLKFSPQTPPQESPTYNDVADMDMSDSDQELGNKPSKIVAVDTNTMRQNPIRPTTIAASVVVTPIIKTTIKQPSGTLIKRPGMRGASTSVSIFKQELPIPKSSIQSTPTKTNFPISFNGSIKTGFDSKISTPSASPPSPEGSPELNISSPPRHQSLESRLADLFSGNAKVNLSTRLENTGSESDTDSITNISTKKDSSSKTENVEQFASGGNLVTDSDDRQITLPQSSHDDIIRTNSPSIITSQSSWQNDKYVSTATTIEDESWQNTIPVIGGSGNRLTAPSQNRSFMGNLHLVLDGSSTPVQDELLSDGENFQSALMKTSPVQKESLLPPPSFSGDALNFLTQFMGQKTNTVLSQANEIPQNDWDTATTTTASQPSPTKSKNILQNLGIDWNSIQNITSTVKSQSNSSWPQEKASTTNSNQQKQSTSQLSDRDTDYRTSKSGKRPTNIDLNDNFTAEKEVEYFTESLKEVGRDNLLTLTPTSAAEPANQFMDILKKKSSEQTPSFAPMSDEVIVEEEEILVEEENSNSGKRNHEQHNELNNQNEVNSNNSDTVRPNFNELHGPPIRNNFPPQKRHLEEPKMQDGFNFKSGLRPSFQPRVRAPQRPPFSSNDHRPPFRGNFRPRGPHTGERFSMRPPVRRPSGSWNKNHDVDFRSRPRQPHPAVLEEEYYDMLYDELKPKFRRGENMPGRFLNRMPHR
ncbi:uncharacterized protein LOC120343211 isoform X1 [Styela clava]